MVIYSNARILKDNEFYSSNIYVENGKIVDINDSLDSKYETISCEGLAILPALVDINISTKDNILSTKSLDLLAKKAIKGGVGSIFIDPLTTPRNDSEAMNAFILNKSRGVNLFPLICALNKDNKLENIDILSSSMPKSSIVAFSDMDSNLLLQSINYAKMLDMPLIIYARDSLLQNGVAYSSFLSSSLGLPSFSFLAQIKEVAKIYEMARFMDVRVIFTRLNIPDAINLLDSKHAFTQVPLPHLLLDEGCIKEYDTTFKLNPPLLPLEHKANLLECLKNGKIDMLTSLHNAFSNHLKERIFEEASSGLNSLEHYFSASYSLVKNGLIQLCDLVRLTSTNPSKILGLNKGRIEIGYDADFIMLDLDSSYVLDSKSAFKGLKLYGEVKKMVINGAIVS